MSSRVDIASKWLRNQQTMRKCTAVAPKVKSRRVVIGDTSVAPSSKRLARDEATGIAQWKDRGGVMRRSDLVPMGEHKLNHDHKNPELGRRKQESNFFITCNLNKNPKDDDVHAYTVALDYAMREMAADRVICQYLIFGPAIASMRGSDHYRDDTYAHHIDKVNYHCGIERGSKRGMVHAHVWLTIDHFSQIQIHPKQFGFLVKEFFNQSVRAQGRESLVLPARQQVFVNVKLLPQSDFAEVIKRYITKTFNDQRQIEPGIAMA